MADKIVKITFEIDGLEQSVTNIDDAKVALEQLESQAKQTGDAADTAAQDFDKLGDSSKDAGEAGEPEDSDESVTGFLWTVTVVTVHGPTQSAGGTDA